MASAFISRWSAPLTRLPAPSHEGRWQRPTANQPLARFPLVGLGHLPSNAGATGARMANLAKKKSRRLQNPCVRAQQAGQEKIGDEMRQHLREKRKQNETLFYERWRSPTMSWSRPFMGPWRWQCLMYLHFLFYRLEFGCIYHLFLAKLRV